MHEIYEKNGFCIKPYSINAPVPPSDWPPTQSATLLPVESCTFLTIMGGVTSLAVVLSRPQD